MQVLYHRLCNRCNKYCVIFLLYWQTERDVSVRQRAVDLLYAMCDKTNTEEIVGEMLEYLEKADYSIREEMVIDLFYCFVWWGIAANLSIKFLKIVYKHKLFSNCFSFFTLNASKCRFGLNQLFKVYHIASLNYLSSKQPVYKTWGRGDQMLQLHAPEVMSNVDKMICEFIYCRYWKLPYWLRNLL